MSHQRFAEVIADIAAGLPPDADAEATMRDRLAALAGVSPDVELPVHEVIRRAHEGLAASGSDLAVVTLDDAVGAHQRPNLPGTVDEHPNWRLPLPVALEDLDAAGAERTARVMRDSGR